MKINRRGISPVIATVIIVAVAIAIAIAVAFWMTGIVGIFTGQVEQLQIVAAIPNATASEVHIIVKNAGTTTVTIDGVFVTPTDVSDGWGTSSGSHDRDVNTIVTNGVQVAPGGTTDIYVHFSTWNSGTSVEIKLHSASGKEYPKLVSLP